MAIDATHREYDASLPAWARARDVLAGEDAVKAAGEKYLARLDSQSDGEYAAYKERASFFGATARTVKEYLDLVFRKAPVLAFGSSEGLRKSAEDCDLWGLSFIAYARRVVGEVLAVGRGGSLVLWDEAGRPVVSFWKAESILNWRVERVGGGVVLVEVVLQDRERLRTMRLIESACVQEVWYRSAEASAEGSDAAEEGWVCQQRVCLRREGAPLTFVPFVFHGPRNSRPEADALPLADIIAANLDHYRLDADYKQGLHFAALPTAWVSGFDKSAPLRIGSSTAWVSEVQGASAGYLEFSGRGLAHLERAIEKVERRMVLLGARMLEGDGEPTSGGGSGHLCGLGSIVEALNVSLSQVLRMAQWWSEGGELRAQTASIAMETDLSARVVSGELISAVVGAWRDGAISRETMLDWLKRWEVLPEGRSVAQERALIHGKAKG
jgi:hypothetical protein